MTNERFPPSTFTRYQDAAWLIKSMQGLVTTYYLTYILLPIFLGWYYWPLASRWLLKGLYILCVVAAVVVSLLLADCICNMNSISKFCVALLPTVAISTFMMWKVFGFNLLSVALPYGVVAVVLIAIKFWIDQKSSDSLNANDIERYNGIFHVFSLGFVALSIFPVCAIKILRGTIQFSKLAKDIFLSITMLCLVVFVCNVIASLWMFGNGVFLHDLYTENLLSRVESSLYTVKKET